MNFYKILSKYYDDIFPVDLERIEFVNHYISNSDSILDIGCATGSTIITLKKNNYNCKFYGIDLDEAMVKLAIKKSLLNNLDIQFSTLDMINIEKNFAGKRFNLIINLGNTLPHLLKSEDILNFFKQAYNLLEQNGVFIIQLLNYDRIIDQNITKLPEIETASLIFNREYDLTNKNRIKFTSQVNDKKTGEVFEKHTYLNPIRKDEIIHFATKINFQNIKTYKNYTFEESTSNDYYTLFVLKK